MIEKLGEEWFFIRGKYKGLKVKTIADRDRNYLDFLYKKASVTYSDEQFYAIQDIVMGYTAELKE